MATIRIYKVAEVLGIPSQEVIDLLKREHGIEAKSASSTIEEIVAKQFAERIARAKALQEDVAHVESSQSPTRTRGTARGAILGTASYMSPEQARGEDVDQRSDIWAFGCVLYEAHTGKPAFRESTLAETLAAILNREPEWSALPSGTPLLIRRLLHRCLQKDVRRRWQHAGDVRIELEEAASASDGALAAAMEPQ